MRVAHYTRNRSCPLSAPARSRSRARETAWRAKVPGGELIDGDTRPDVRAVGLARLAAGQVGRHGPGVVSGPIPVRPGLAQVQAGQEGQLVPLRHSSSAIHSMPATR